jgi:hypothetical protein
MKYRYIFALVIVLIVTLTISHIVRKRTIFTCTTFFDFEKQDRWESFQRCITKIHHYHTFLGIDHWVIVNEYSATPKQDWVQRMAATYPYMTFIQKSEDQKGQAASLNIILEHIKPYDYWIQWEDSWYPERAFLDRAYMIMNSTNLTQIQFTKLKGTVNWLDIPKERQINHNSYIEVKAVADIDTYLDRSPYDYDHKWAKSWPLFSLLPSINRVSHIHSLGTFSTDPVLWPIKFEWDFARHWYRAGGTKAVLPDGPAIRSGHISTYSK